MIAKKSIARLAVFLAILFGFPGWTLAKPITLLNVSYDTTREFYKAYNTYFQSDWQKKTGQSLTILQSHGGSGKQARAVIDGLEADVVTLALAYDIDAISQKTTLLPKDWEHQLPHHNAPYSSTIVFLVRKGNPKQIKDWPDLAKPGIQVITPNPKTSGGARWNFLAAWGSALSQTKSETKAKSLVTAIYKNVPVLDSGARGSTLTFTQRQIGDVLIAWEDEALLITRKRSPGQYDIVYPSISILAQPPVALVLGNTQKHGTTEVARAYLQQLYSTEGQTIAARHFYRPRQAPIQAKFADQFPDLKRFTMETYFGNWKKAQARFFDDGGVFDEIYQPH